MEQYPKWLLALSAGNLFVPILTMVFFLFGGVRLFAPIDHALLSFLCYVLLQLFWLFPIVAFFVGLHLWGQEQEKKGLFVLGLGWGVALLSVFVLCCA